MPYFTCAACLGSLLSLVALNIIVNNGILSLVRFGSLNKDIFVRFRDEHGGDNAEGRLETTSVIDVCATTSIRVTMLLGRQHSLGDSARWLTTRLVPAPRLHDDENRARARMVIALRLAAAASLTG